MRHALIRPALLCAVALGAVAAQAGTAGAGQSGTVVVCPGRYREDVQILTKRVIMRGRPGAVIDAAGRSTGCWSGYRDPRCAG